MLEIFMNWKRMLLVAMETGGVHPVT